MKHLKTVIAVSALSIMCFASAAADAQPAQANAYHPRAARAGTSNSQARVPVRHEARAKAPMRTDARRGAGMKGHPAGRKQGRTTRGGKDLLGKVLNTVVRSAVKAQRSSAKHPQAGNKPQPKQAVPAR